MNRAADKAWRLFRQAQDLPMELHAEFLRKHEHLGDLVMCELRELLASYYATEALRGPNLVAGERWGDYLLERPLGRGGFGAVWLAAFRPLEIDGENAAAAKEHDQVALKIAQPAGSYTAEFFRRLALESQVLRKFDHPGIPRILDSRKGPPPFLVLEFVDGPPITQYAERAGLSLDPRLQLIVDVCRSVEHAHGHGVLHRDIKPTNVLVTLEDGLPVVKVIDFGIARILDDEGDARTGLTLAGESPGTLAYMAPEQLAPEGERPLAPLSVRTDVFGIGRLLFELVVREQAVRVGRGVGLSNAAIRNRILEEEPASPLARSRELEGDESEVSRELDLVVRRAMERHPNRRYQTVAALRGDLEALLDGRPIAARAPAAWVRAGRALRRRRGGLLAVTPIIVLLSALAWVSWRGKQVAIVEKERLARTVDAMGSHLASLESAELAVALRDALMEQIDREGDSGRRRQAIEVLERIDFTSLARASFDASYFKSAEAAFRKGLAGEPLVLADLLEVLSRSRTKLALHESALLSAEESLRLRSVELGEDAPETIRSLETVVQALLGLQDQARGVPAAQELLRLCVRLEGVDSERALRAKTQIGRFAAARFDFAAAETVAREIVAQLEQMEGVEAAFAVASCAYLAQVLFQVHDFDGAIEFHRKAVVLARASSSELPEEVVLKAQVGLARALATLASLGQPELLNEARTIMQPAADRLLSLQGGDHDEGLGTLNALAILARAEGDREKLLELTSRCYRRWRLRYGGENPTSIQLQANVVIALVDADQPEEALALADAVADLASRAGEPMPLVLAAMDAEKARAYATLGEFSAAEGAMLKGIRRYEAALGLGEAQTQQAIVSACEIYAAWLEAETDARKLREHERWYSKLRTPFSSQVQSTASLSGGAHGGLASDHSSVVPEDMDEEGVGGLR